MQKPFEMIDIGKSDKSNHSKKTPKKQKQKKPSVTGDMEGKGEGSLSELKPE